MSLTSTMTEQDHGWAYCYFYLWRSHEVYRLSDCCCPDDDKKLGHSAIKTIKAINFQSDFPGEVTYIEK